MMVLTVSTADTTEAYSAKFVRSVVACGVKLSEVSAGWEPELQDFVVTIRQPRIRDDVMACLVRLASISPVVDFQFSSPSLQSEFDEAQSSTPEAHAASERGRAESRNWLARHGLLAGALAIRRQAGSLSERAARIEAYCGFPPGSMLEVQGDSLIIRHSSGTEVTYRGMRKLLAVLDVAAPEHPVALVGEVVR
jgi:hypothetical protein